MELKIDGHNITARPDMTLLDLIRALGLYTDHLATRPIAAKIAGEVFNLNYIPVRRKDIDQERPSIRRAMAASGGVVKLIRYDDPKGKDVYTRTAQFLLFLAIQQLWPKARAKMTCTVGAGLYIKVTGVLDFSAEKLKTRLMELVSMDIPLVRRRVATEEAAGRFEENGQPDKSRLLRWREAEWFDEYAYGAYADYFYGEMAPSTGYLKVWEILPAQEGFLFIFPDDGNPDAVARVQEMPNFFSVFSEGERWCTLMECETVADLNDLTMSGGIRELIRVNEALHEKRFSQIADQISARGAKAVMLERTSSSGKSASAHRLATQLRVRGKKPILMSLDDYYIDRDEIAPGPDGKLDLEHINTIDTALFRQQLRMLLSGETVELPRFNFVTGKREWRGKRLQ